jgi:hypothetical protein
MRSRVGRRQTGLEQNIKAPSMLALGQCHYSEGVVESYRVPEVAISKSVVALIYLSLCIDGDINALKCGYGFWLSQRWFDRSKLSAYIINS